MADTIRTNAELLSRNGISRQGNIHPAWQRLMDYCAELRHGEIQNLRIQDGLPMAAEVTMKKIKFST